MDQPALLEEKKDLVHASEGSENITSYGKLLNELASSTALEQEYTYSLLYLGYKSHTE
jgi:hypothetical protein